MGNKYKRKNEDSCNIVFCCKCSNFYSRRKVPNSPRYCQFRCWKVFGRMVRANPIPDAIPPSEESKCIRATYGFRDATSVTVNNTAIEPERGSDLWYLSWILGKAEQVSPDTHPNKLLVSFNFNPARALRDRRSNYNVMDTDYENYTIVMDCVEIRHVGSVEFGWILSRDQKFRESEMFSQVHKK